MLENRKHGVTQAPRRLPHAALLFSPMYELCRLQLAGILNFYLITHAIGFGFCHGTSETSLL